MPKKWSCDAKKRSLTEVYQIIQSITLIPSTIPTRSKKGVLLFCFGEPSQARPFSLLTNSGGKVRREGPHLDEGDTLFWETTLTPVRAY